MTRTGDREIHSVSGRVGTYVTGGSNLQVAGCGLQVIVSPIQKVS